MLVSFVMVLFLNKQLVQTINNSDMWPVVLTAKEKLTDGI